jgi:hypothetical protein
LLKQQQLNRNKKYQSLTIDPKGPLHPRVIEELSSTFNSFHIIASTMTSPETQTSSPAATRASYGAQLKQIKKNWDTSNVPRGGVAARIQGFKALSDKKADPELTNTGRTNKNVHKFANNAGSDHQAEQLKGDPTAFKTKKEAKNKAATKIQAMVRAKHAQKLAKRHIKESQDKEKRKKAAITIQTAVRASQDKEKVKKEKEKLDNERKQADTSKRLDRDAAAAIKIQAMVRAALTRMQVCQMVEQLIAGLMAEQLSKEEEADRLKAEEEERLKCEEVIKVSEEARRKAATEKKADAEAEAVARRKLTQRKPECFIGPLQTRVGLLPEWWLQYTPHFIEDMDTFDEQVEKLWQVQNADAAMYRNNQSWNSEYDYVSVTESTLNESEMTLGIESDGEPE